MCNFGQPTTSSFIKLNSYGSIICFSISTKNADALVNDNKLSYLFSFLLRVLIIILIVKALTLLKQ